MIKCLQSLDKFGQKVVVRTAQLDCQPRSQLDEQIVRRSELVVLINSRRHEGVQVRALETPRVPAHQLARGQARLDDRLHARVAVDDAAHVHNFRNPADLRPRQHLDHRGAAEVCPGKLETGR